MNSSIDIIEALFGGPGRIAILRALARTTAPLTGRQVAELAGLSAAGASRALDRFAALGVVTRRRVGRAVLHELQRESLVVQTIVLPVFHAEQELLPRLERDLAETFGPEAVSVVLYGSIARRQDVSGSDIDVLVVTESEQAALRADELAAEEGPRFYRAYGKPLSVIAKTADDLRDTQASFALKALAEGHTVAGLPLEEVVRGGT